MSIASDVKGYADAALEQGKKSIDTAQALVAEAAGDATGFATKVQTNAVEIVGKAGGTASEVADKVQTTVLSLPGKATETVGELRSKGESLVGAAKSVDVKAVAKSIDLETVKSTVEQYLSTANELRAVITDKADEIVADLKKDPRIAKAYGTFEAVTGSFIETVNDKVVVPALSLVGRKPAKPAAKPAAKTTAAKAPAKKVAAKTTAAKPAAKAPAKKVAAKKA